MRTPLRPIAFLAVLAAPAWAPLHAQQPSRRETRPASSSLQPAGDSLTILFPRALSARAIGPAIMGGRVSSIAIDPKSPSTIYMGLGTGGVMKSTDNGTTWSAIFEKEATASIGDVKVAPSDPNVVWVATGEGNDRNSITWGAGVYRSTDAGATWTQAGLRDGKQIARLAVHPTDPQVAWAAVGGDLWSPSAERGIYKTTDGGKSWKKVLGAPAPYDNRVGGGDVLVDPSNPEIVYAALYARQRRPWLFLYGPRATDGKDLGGIFRSTDGGNSWSKLTNGLPGQTGRIGLALYAKNPKIVYATVQSDEGGTQNIDDVTSKRGGTFRSDDGGSTWTRMSNLNPRPFYFSQIRVDPANDQHIYVLGFALHVSEDGGRTWREDRFKNVHPDLHALAIDPTNPQRLLLGTDGGIYQSYNAAATWDHVNNIAAGEFYRVNVDNSTPYRICGGLQDNTNWVGPSMVPTKDGIRNGDWTTLGGGDGSWCAFDALDSNLVYAESQQGYLFRLDLRSGQGKNLRPEPTEGLPAYRFHWMAPLIQSRHHQGTMYYAGNHVFRLTEHGEQFTQISPDLSSKDYDRMRAGGSGAEDFGVVYALAESPAKAGMLWAGTDDGQLWKTEDDGGSWTNLTSTLPAAAKGHWIYRIEAGHADANVAYVVVDAHRDGVYSPFIYRTQDGGRTWTNVASSMPAGEVAKVVREDPANPNVLYAGTETGFWATLNRGRTWQKIGDLPTVAVDDILFNEKTGDIVLATHGRSLYVIDDARAIAALPAAVTKPVELFPIRPVTAYQPLDGSVDWDGAREFRGKNPPAGALITYWVKGYTGDAISIAVTDAAGRAVANLTAPATPGLNRVVWDLKPTSDLLTSYGGEGQKFVKAGKYTVTLTMGAAKSTQTVDVRTAPGLETR